MRDIFVISDTHFGHENIIRYCNRPFANAELMDECMADNWNSVVKAEDIVYHLGDVYFSGAYSRLYNLNGRKRLILGNHDNGKDQRLQEVFQKIMVWRMFPEFGLLLSHIPLHETVLQNSYGYNLINVHGHIHNQDAPSDRHINVSVEQINYTPTAIEDLIKKKTN